MVELVIVAVALYVSGFIAGTLDSHYRRKRFERRRMTRVPGHPTAVAVRRPTAPQAVRKELTHG